MSGEQDFKVSFSGHLASKKTWKWADWCHPFSLPKAKDPVRIHLATNLKLRILLISVLAKQGWSRQEDLLKQCHALSQTRPWDRGGWVVSNVIRISWDQLISWSMKKAHSELTHCSSNSYPGRQTLQHMFYDLYHCVPGNLIWIIGRHRPSSLNGLTVARSITNNGGYITTVDVSASWSVVDIIAAWLFAHIPMASNAFLSWSGFLPLIYINHVKR